MVEPYNSVLTTHTAMEHADVTFLVDNDAVFSICKNKMEVARSSYRELNQLISQVITSVICADYNPLLYVAGCVLCHRLSQIPRVRR